MMELNFFRKLGFSSYLYLSRSDRSLVIEGAGSLTFFFDLFQIVFVVGAIVYTFHKSKWLKFMFVTAIINNIGYMLIIIDRSGLLEVLIPLTFFLLHYKKITSRFAVIAGVSAFLFLSFFKVIMTNLIMGTSTKLPPFKMNDEFEAWYGIGIRIFNDLKDGSISMLYGRSYLDAMYNMIVPFTNTESLSIWYVKTYYYQTYIAGGGKAFSSIAEAVMNFGYIGVPIYFMFLGLLCRWLKKRMNSDIKFLVFYVLMFTVMYKFFRSEFYSLVKTNWWYYIIPLSIIFLVSKVNPKKVSKPAMQILTK